MAVHARRPGTVQAWVVVSLPGLLAIAAITIDGGRSMEQRTNQVVADAAALAAASDLYMNYASAKGQDTSGTAKAAALQIAASNGFPASSVSVFIPPQSGTFAGQAGHTEVVIQTDVSASFARAITTTNIPVKARSVARGQPMKVGMILLQASGSNALVNNALAFTIVNCPLRINSTDSAAYNQASFGAVVASRIDLSGDYINPGGAVMIAKVRKGVAPTPDPLAHLPVPDSSSLPVRSSSQTVVNSLIPTTLYPGIYFGGIRIRNLSVVTMQPGIYIMQGGGFQVEDTSTVLGLETFIYNSHDVSHAAGAISITSLGKVVLTAPSSGTYQGLSVFQHRGQTTPITLKGFGLSAISGLFYAPKAAVNLTGSVAVGLDILGGAYVVESATVNGIGAIHLDLNNNHPRIPDIRLVE